MLLPQVTMPMGSSMGHVRNLDLSDLFLNIYHFYTKALLSVVSINIPNWKTEPSSAKNVDQLLFSVYGTYKMTGVPM